MIMCTRRGKPVPKFSEQSKRRLSQCDPRLQEIFEAIVKVFDCTIITGHRNKEDQDEMFRLGKSKLKFPDGKHNQSPALAVDVVPWPIDWTDRERFTFFAGYVLGIAQSKGINLRWGGDWNRDWQVKDNGFDDLLHFEIVL